MRNEGDVTFYTVEMNGYGGTRWHGVGEGIWSKIPSAIRHKDCKPYSGTSAEPFQSYSASGKLWQATGHHGWYDIGPATEAMMLLAQYNEGTEFRVVQERRLFSRKQIAKVLIEGVVA